MDPLTHVVSGVLLGQAVKSRFGAARGIVPFAALAAWIPDVDNFLPGGAEIYLRYHRGITHSWIGGGALGILLALTFWLLTRRRLSFPKLAGVAVVGVYIHVFLDLITSYGTQIWLPFSDARATLNAVFIIDPVFTLAMLALAIAAATKRAPRFARAGVALIVLYPALAMGVRFMTAHALERALRSEGREFSQLHVVPDAFSPWFWKVIVETDSTYAAAGHSPWESRDELRFTTFDKADRKALRASEVSLVRTFEWFAAFPARTDREGRTLVSDLRFMSAQPWLAKLRGPDLPFTLQITPDEDGNPVSARMLSEAAPAPWSLPNSGQ